MNQSALHSANSNDPIWGDIGREIDALAKLAQSERSPTTFYQNMIDVGLKCVGAIDGAVSTGNATIQFDLNRTRTVADQETISLRDAIRSRMFEWSQHVWEAKTRETRDGCFPVGKSPSSTASEFCVVASPILDGSDVVAVVLFAFDRASNRLEPARTQLLDVIIEITESYQRRLLAENVSRNLQVPYDGLPVRRCSWTDWKSILRPESYQEFPSPVASFTDHPLSLMLHREFDMERLAYVIANEGQKFLACDRLSVAVNSPTWLDRARAPKILAVSGIDRIDDRSEFTIRLQRLLRAMSKRPEATWSDSLPTESSPEDDRCFHEFSDVSNSRLIGLLPLVASERKDTSEVSAEGANAIIGWLVAECTTIPTDAERRELERRAHQLVPHSQQSLANALFLASIPFGRWLRATFENQLWRSRGLSRAWMIGIAAAVVLLALALVPAELTIRATGELRPKQERNLFAPSDAVVTAIGLPSDGKVTTGDVLLRLTSVKVNMELARLEGELETTRRQLIAVKAARIAGTSNGASNSQLHLLAADEERLDESVRGLDAQLAIVRRESSELTLKSPIDGTVLTWQADKLLASRPVQRGQLLLTIANSKGDWGLLLDVPDNRVSHLREAFQSGHMSINYLLATDPNRTYRAKLSEIAPSIESDSDSVSGLRVRADVDDDQLPQCPPGTSVIAQIRCGQRSIGYVWFHGVIDAVTRFLFR